MSKLKKNIVIVGSGAIGLLWYSHFNLNNTNAVNCFLFQSATRKKIKSKIKFTTITNETHYFDSHVLTEQKVLTDQNASIDIIIVCVKSYQLNQAIEDIKNLISNDTLIITTHNGLGALNSESINILENNPVLDMLTTHGCLKLSDNEIKHTGTGQSHLGVKFDKNNIFAKKSHQTMITDLLHSTLPNLVWCEELESKQWLKLAINCVINPLTALYDVKNGDVSNDQFTQTIEEIIDEIVAIASAKNITLDKSQLIETVLLVAKNTAQNSSSMRCDVQQNRPTEIEYINGYIHKLGQELNILTPKNTELYHKLLRH